MTFVAALRGIPDDLLEAASIERTSGWQQFARIKLPLILPVVGMVAILAFVNNFNAFDAVYAMENANGAPGYATDLIGTLFYRVGIAGQRPVGIPDPGLGLAIATVTFLMLACGVIPTLKLTTDKRVAYEQAKGALPARGQPARSLPFDFDALVPCRAVSHLGAAVNSFKTRSTIYENPFWIPKIWNFSNYSAVLRSGDFLVYFRNSFVAVVSSIALVLAPGALRFF